MNIDSPWTEGISKKTGKRYYYNRLTNSSLWKIESPEKGWGRTLIDSHHPERGEKFVNIFTNRVFYSEEDYKRYITSYRDSVGSSSYMVWKVVNCSSIHRNEPSQSSVKRGSVNENEFSGLIEVNPKRARVKDVQENYDKEDKTIDQRNLSVILHLRNLDNWVKFTLIRTYCPRKSRVLDLACGKGGDLKKWKKQNIYYYVGVDIASGSISDAVARFKSQSNPGFPARFIVANLGVCDLRDAIQSVGAIE